MASDHTPDSAGGSEAVIHFKSRSPTASRAPGPSPSTAAKTDPPITQMSPGSAKKPRLSTPSLQGSPVSRMEEDGGPQLSLEEKTPSQQSPRTPRAPAAPSKSGSSSYERTQPSPAVRSLTPIFNGCTGAAERARQMGGQYAVKLRRPQRAGSGSLPPSDNNSPVNSASTGGLAPGGSGSRGPKLSRSRSVLSELLARPPSVLTDRSRGSPAPGLPAAGPSRGAAAVAAAVGLWAPASGPTPIPSPLSLHVGALTTQLLGSDTAVIAAGLVAEGVTWQARRVAGRQPGLGQGGEAQPQVLLRSAAFKPR